MLRRGRGRRERGVWGEEEGKKCGGSETGLLGDGARTGAAPPHVRVGRGTLEEQKCLIGVLNSSLSLVCM